MTWSCCFRYNTIDELDCSYFITAHFKNAVIPIKAKPPLESKLAQKDKKKSRV